MRHLGFPIVGDSVYGRRLKKNAPMPDDLRTVVESFPRQALHARFLSLEHPEHRQTMKFEAVLPDDMADLLSALDRFDSR
jgi:23S rRNA pseudouridine1911/1915/1917 synthase